MKRLLVAGVVALAVAAAALAAPVGGGHERAVSIPGKLFAPNALDVLVGDTVVWRNGDSTSHTVTADDDSFDSGFVSPGGTFAETFSKPGIHAYHCSIHRFMHGVVRVVAVALSAPEGPVLSGGRVVLSGLAPDGVTRVAVTRSVGAPAVRVVVPGADGSFTVSERVFRPVNFRAIVLPGRSGSRPVQVRVAPKVVAHRAVNRLVAVAKPARAGARAALQAFDLEHFIWRTVGRGVIDRASHVAFALPAGHGGRFRIVVRGARGWADGASQAVVVRV